MTEFSFFGCAIAPSRSGVMDIGKGMWQTLSKTSNEKGLVACSNRCVYGVIARDRHKAQLGTILVRVGLNFTTVSCVHKKLFFYHFKYFDLFQAQSIKTIAIHW